MISPWQLVYSKEHVCFTCMRAWKQFNMIFPFCLFVLKLMWLFWLSIIQQMFWLRTTHFYFQFFELAGLCWVVLLWNLSCDCNHVTAGAVVIASLLLVYAEWLYKLVIQWELSWSSDEHLHGVTRYSW